MIYKKDTSNNKTEYKMYEDLKGIEFIPRLISSAGGLDIFESKGEGGYNKPLNKQQLVALTIMLKFIHNASSFKCGGEVYLNNKLTMDNIAFSPSGTPIQILDWSECSIGDGTMDFIMIIDQFIDLKGKSYSKKEAFQRIVEMGQFYNSCGKPLGLGKKMKAYYENKIIEADLCCKEKDAMKKLEFVEEFMTQLDEF